ncbi:hypothetical protein [Pseudomonas parakoreensis]|uniref:hypothetical protein n=1 Tax=Pseudomonas parakoreensis TaxID=2892331 RepID=UPI003FD1B33D
MLKAPNTELPFKPTVDSLLAGLDTEYKDENFKKSLLALDPNDPIDRIKIIENFIIKDQEYLTYRHKYLLVEELEKALSEQDFDFTQPFEYDYESDEASSSPWSADEINTPRSFFEAILRLTKQKWKSDLAKAAIEDQSTW